MIVFNEEGRAMIAKMQDLLLRAYGTKGIEYLNEMNPMMMFDADIKDKYIPTDGTEKGGQDAGNPNPSSKLKVAGE